MKSLLARAVLILAACFALPAFSQTIPACDQRTTGLWTDIRLTWSPPTQFTNNTAIPAGAALTYRVSRQIGTGTWTIQCQTPLSSATIWNTAAGQYNLRVTATLAGQESGPSAVAGVVLVEPVFAPKPPGSLVIVVPVVP